MAQYPSNSVLRQPGDPHLGHHVRYLRVVRRGNRVIGKKRLQRLHKSFRFQPAIGVNQDGFVGTLCLSENRYKDLESSRPAASLVYTAEGGVHKSSRRLIKDQNPDTRRNRALRRSAQDPASPYAQLWFGVPPRSTNGPDRGCNTYTYCGLYKVSNWTRNVDRATGFEYFTVDLRRKQDAENSLWVDRLIV